MKKMIEVMINVNEYERRINERKLSMRNRFKLNVMLIYTL